MKNRTDVRSRFQRDVRELGKFIKSNDKEYKKYWKMIKNSYGHIYVCRIFASSIGEFVARYLMIKEDIIGKSKDLYVFVPFLSKGELANRNLLELIGNEICIVNANNFGFWKYVFSKYNKELDFTYYDKYSGRRDTYYRVYLGKPILNISNIQNSVCRAISKKIGIHGEYVCFYSRDSFYNIHVLGKDFREFKYRNNRFENYFKSIDYLQMQNIQAVRMGKYIAKGNYDKNGIVDFGGKFYIDFMDIFLMSSCKFFVGSNSGINFVAKVFARPVLIVNSVYVTVGSACEINMQENMLIPKKYYSKRAKKYLSMKAIARYERLFGDDTSRYEERGIEILENTPQEILDAVVEMNERLDGNWKDTEEDILLQEKYRKLLYQLNEGNRKRFWNGGGTLYRIGSKYLRDNRYLIDE